MVCPSTRRATEQRSVAVSIASKRMKLPVDRGRCIHRIRIGCETDGAQALMQELLYVDQVLRAWHRGQAVEKDPAIAFGAQSFIAQHDHAEVVRIAHQTANALFQSDDRLRDL